MSDNVNLQNIELELGQIKDLLEQIVGILGSIDVTLDESNKKLEEMDRKRVF